MDKFLDGGRMGMMDGGKWSNLQPVPTARSLIVRLFDEADEFGQIVLSLQISYFADDCRISFKEAVQIRLGLFEF